MTKTPSKARSPSLATVFPPRAQEAFARELVAFQLEELNGLGDRLRYLATEAGPGDGARIAEVWGRCGEILDALRWNADEVIRCVLRELELPPEAPEDLFGPALILSTFQPDDLRVQTSRDRPAEPALALRF